MTKFGASSWANLSPILMGLVFACGCSDNQLQVPWNQGDTETGSESIYDTELQGSDTNAEDTDSESTSETDSEPTSETDSGSIDDPKLSASLRARILDFSKSHADFGLSQIGGEVTKGIVKPDLGDDGKPVYASASATSVNPGGRHTFPYWYTWQAKTNISYTYEIPLEQDDNGQWFFSRDPFLPLKIEEGFGHEEQTDIYGELTNFNFTLEIQTTFQHSNNQTLTVTSDDDAWVFINDKLVIDLGGIHAPKSETLELDQVAYELGLVPGEAYSLSIFFAQRSSYSSAFGVSTSMDLIFDGTP